MESLNGKEPLSENEEETLVGEEIGEVGEIAYWKAKAKEWRNVALESRLELEEFQNESRYKTHLHPPHPHNFVFVGLSLGIIRLVIRRIVKKDDILLLIISLLKYFTAVRRHCTDWYETGALTDHEIYYIKIVLDLSKFACGPFSEREEGFGVGLTPRDSQCTGVSSTLSPSFGPIFERNHSCGVKMMSQNVLKC